ncbi:CYFA0S18e00188g1_1 [Cyberlindnera fabianii]|uniref:ER membrane protein complex subunit 4 n=1 Tax=Cyberlindnera fabianii TaxID=36022 RepID=A0A061B688_CYBFA|nr:ER membrane protein complex subunit 4 [Cyberlindnera fabianii]CDR45364.1 CYFA0S18e00188g1_1 [Cyberlindnera fabianii]
MSWYQDLTTPIRRKPLERVESPQGFQDQTRGKNNTTVTPAPQQKQIDALKVTKAWEIATGPAKQIPMNLFMSYMSGNSLQIIPITMTLMLFSNAFSAIIAVNTAFTGLESEKTSNDLKLAKLTYLFFQLCVIGIGVWKLNNMGLIPNRTGDWLSWEEPTIYLQRVL